MGTFPPCLTFQKLFFTIRIFAFSAKIEIISRTLPHVTCSYIITIFENLQVRKNLCIMIILLPTYDIAS